MYHLINKALTRLSMSLVRIGQHAMKRELRDDLAGFVDQQ